jgi:putative oxidoreductase
MASILSYLNCMSINRNDLIQVAVTLLRVAAGIMFMQGGGMKLFGWFGGMPGAGGPPEVMSQIWFAGVLETFGGALMIIGLLTRPVAFLLSGEMAVAYWQVHAPKGTWPAENHGMDAVLYCFIFLFFAAYGAGAWSVDAFVFNKPWYKKNLTEEQ